MTALKNLALNGNEITAEVIEALKDPAKVEAMAREGDLSRIEKESGFIRIGSYLNGFMQYLQRIRSRVPVNTGFAELDQCLGGGLPPGYITIGGPTGTGKTALAMQISANVAANGGLVCYVSLEMDVNTLIARELSRLSFLCRGQGIRPLTHVEVRRSENALQVETLAGHFFKTVGKNLVIMNLPRKSAKAIYGDMCNYFEAMRRAPSLIVVDYLQILEAESGVNLTEKQIIDSSLKAIEAMAHAWGGVPVICLSSVNRASQGRALGLNAYSGSGNIEYGAEVGILLEVYKDPDLDKNLTDQEIIRQSNKAGLGIPLKLNVHKNRNGPSVIELYFLFDGAHCLYTPVTEEKLKSDVRAEARRNAA